MPYKFRVGIAKINKLVSMSFRRASLVASCLVMVFTIAMPNQVMALNLFGQKPQPSILRSEKVEVANAQSASDRAFSTDMSPKKEDRTIEREDESKRTANSSTYINKDGTKTFEYSLRQKNFRNGDKWEKVDNKLTELKQNIQNPSFWQTITNTTPKVTQEFTGKAGLMGVRMMPLTKGVEMSVGGKTVTMKPVGASNVRPEKKNDSTTLYKDAWKGVDLEYQAEGELLKENIIIKQKDVATEYEFKLGGAKLIDDPKNPGSLTIEGAQDGYKFGGLTLALQDRGPIQIPEKSIKQEKTGDNSIKISLDKAWLESLPSDSFPLVIDPSFGRWDSDPTDWMFKSDGYSCQGNTCWIQAGTLYDGGWKHWRSYVHIPYPELAGKKVLGANVHAYYNPNANPDPNQRYLFFGHANCIGWECRGKHLATVLTAGDFDVNVTDELQLAVNAGDMGAVWSFWGEEVPYKTFKTYSDMSLYVVYDTPTPVAQPIDSADKQVTVTTQPTLRVNPVGDADGDAVKYYYRVSTSPDAETGAVINSGWTTAAQWTIPDGILQDGTTYYWHTYTVGATQTNPNWVRSFRVDLRTGKDSTQAYDTVGPVGVDLATGNAAISTGTHTMSALGGTIGLNFDYNTPTKSKPGLMGEYWNVSSSHNFSAGAPSGTPNLKSHDQTINFSWPNGSSPAAGINSDWFYVRWKGYFVAPTTGSYQFGASQDDAVDINVNGQSFSGCPGVTPCYYGAPITLQAGQVVPITVNYEEATGDGYFRMYVKGAVAEQIVPSDWLRTEVQASAAQYGLAGRYYTDDGSHNFPSNTNDPNRFIMARTDSKLSFNWGGAGPAPGLQTDNYMTRWTGYITVPTSGSYTFGKNSDDGVRIKLNNGMFGTEQTVFDSWNYTPGDMWGSPTNLAAGQQIPITIDYYEQTGPAYFTLKLKGPGLHSDGEEVPVKWLTPKASALPDAWQLGIDVDGNISYERLRVAGQNVVLEDSTRATHEYTWTGSAFKPPVNEDGQLTRNSDNTYTLLDADGRTYIFNAEGKLKSLTTPADDRSPASLKYEYAGDPSRLMKITDGVTNARFGTLHYKGLNEDGNCSVPGGFDSAPDGMLCAFKTSDGDTTKLYYKAGQLSRVEKPGNELVDFGYDSLGRIVSTRDSLANDAIAASARPDDASLTTELTYDQLGRANAIKAPAPTVGAARINHTLEYLAGATQMHIAGATEPHGFSKRVEYDSLLRTTKETDLANLSMHTQWDPVKDLVLSKTDATGLKSTTIYDKLDRATDQYGAAPAAWFDGNRLPLPAYVSQVPHTQTGYDEGINGLAISVFNNTKLTGAPKLYTTSMNQAAEPAYVLDLTNPTVTPTDGLSMRATGKIRLDQVGTYAFRFYNGGGARLYIDGQLKVDNWAAGNERFSGEGNYYNDTPGKLVSITIEAYKGGTSGSNTDGRIAAVLQQRAPGQSVITGTNVASQLTPAYNLATSQTAFDSQLGNVTTKTNYANPAYGTIASTVLDPTGLNYTSQATYESPGAGFLRQTSKTLPGGGTTTYQHYGATDTRDNPCTVETEAIHQGGRPKGKIEADPDGAGPHVGRTSETVYNASGEAIATRYNNDPWTCTAYDARGRIQSTTIPVIGSAAGRTVTNDYAKEGNPLITTTTDSQGTVRVENDLLGRTVKYVDTYGKETVNTYDTYGKLTSRTSQIGTESYEYDTYDRLTVQKLDSVTFATVSYDQYSRLATVQYPAGISLSSIGRDALGRENSTSFIVNSQTYTDTIERYVSGDIKQGVENGATKQYAYDNAGRLTSATIGGNVFAYEFGAPDASCSGLPGYNANTAKNGNRTKSSVNGQVATYCYDIADRLISSSDPTLTDAQYDAHGNTVSLGDAAHKTEFGYDASDRNVSIKANGKETLFTRDSQDRIVGREHKENGTPTSYVGYGFTGSGDSPDFLLDGNGDVVQKYVTLPGDVVVTIKPDSTSAGATTYSLPNIHGDIMATVNADGALIATHLTGPFGEVLSDQTTPNNTATGTSWNYVGQHQKLTDTDTSPISGGIIQMGARVYIPTLGRFLSVDPIEEGTDNNYVYANDPVNQFDLDGRAIPLLIPLIVAAVRVAAPFIARAAVQYVARPAAVFVAKKVVPVLAKKAVAATKKITPVVKGGISKAISYVNKKFPWTNRNNFGRLNTQRIAFGPARSHYDKGGPGSRIPYHFEINWSKKKVFFENVKTGKTKFCFGRSCYR